MNSAVHPLKWSIVNFLAMALFAVAAPHAHGAAPPPKPTPKAPTSAPPPLPKTPYVVTPKTRTQVEALKKKAVDAQSKRVTEARRAMDSLTATAKYVKGRTGIDLGSRPGEGGAFVRAINRHGNEVATLKQLNETSLRDFAAQRNMIIVRRPVQQNSSPAPGPSPSQLSPPSAPARPAKAWRPPGNSEPRVTVRKMQF